MSASAELNQIVENIMQLSTKLNVESQIILNNKNEFGIRVTALSTMSTVYAMAKTDTEKAKAVYNKILKPTGEDNVAFKTIMDTFQQMEKLKDKAHKSFGKKGGKRKTLNKKRRKSRTNLIVISNKTKKRNN